MSLIRQATPQGASLKVLPKGASIPQNLGYLSQRDLWRAGDLGCPRASRKGKPWILDEFVVSTTANRPSDSCVAGTVPTIRIAGDAPGREGRLS